MDNRPIGVFDSGLGGLTGVRELRRRLPHENIVYFGDTGRVPYGSRSPETILQYARQDIAFLLSKVRSPRFRPLPRHGLPTPGGRILRARPSSRPAPPSTGTKVFGRRGGV